MPKIYLCGSITNARVNGLVGDHLQRAGFEVFDPCTIHPRETDKQHFPEEVFARCRQAIETCDVLLVFLDSYGKDSAWEIGFAFGLGKCAVGLVAGSSLFIEDWMIKYSLQRVLVTAGGMLVPVVQSTDWGKVREYSEVVSLDAIPSRLIEILGQRTK